MKPLIVLGTAFGIALLITRLISPVWDFALAGNIAMATMLVFTAIGHFVYPKGMAMMIPDFIPLKTLWVYVTGVFEVLAAPCLVIPVTRHPAAIVLIVFFVCILPANINAAVMKVDFEKASYDGNDLRYLWFRIPLQLFFISWVWFFGMYIG